MNPLSISFIIPAYNEENSLPHTLRCIHEYTPADFNYEIIVADNGSSDKTVDVAKKLKAHVIVESDATVGGLRNIAANHSNGDILIFLDADVLITPEWNKEIIPVIECLTVSPMTVTGSVCSIPAQPNWIERIWFKPLLNRNVKYINSGHLITTKVLFKEINGFSKTLQTGEDYDFSVRATNAGASIINNPALLVIHEGYPASIKEFVSREIWHGKGDCTSISVYLQSKVAIAATLFIVLHLLLILDLLIIKSVILSAISLLLIALMCLTSALLKHKTKKLTDTMVTTMLYYCYYLARFLSCLSVFSTKHKKRQRS